MSDSPKSFFKLQRGTWQERLEFIVETMREMSSATDPETMVQCYGDTMGDLVPSDRFVSLSRRELDRPRVRITRSDLWTEHPNPWKEKGKLPIIDGGLLSELIWADRPAIINNLKIDPNDPAARYFAGMRSLLAVPNYDRGVAMNMVVLMREVPDGYNPELLPEHVWISNLFGRATHNLVLASQVREAYDALDNELRIVAGLQRSLLPAELPNIPGVELAVHYQTSTHAGGDYYDFFPLAGGKWGMLVADVSGHGAPAAVHMAITHSIAHTTDRPPTPPSVLMNFVNRHLADRYTNGNGTFVTAFYGILDPAERSLTFVSAGHPLPRVRSNAGVVASLPHMEIGGLPLGIDAREQYRDVTVRLGGNDLILFYTDGISEARNAAGEMFEVSRIDASLRSCNRATEAVERILGDLGKFTGHLPPSDDQTLLAARLS